MTRLRHSWRWAGMLLAVAALALRVAIPAGFMLAPDGKDRLVVTLCSGHGGPVEGVLDLKTGEFTKKAPGKPDTKTDAPCAFAGLGSAITTPQDFASLALTRVAQIASIPPRGERPSLIPTGPPLPARGPPSFA